MSTLIIIEFVVFLLLEVLITLVRTSFANSHLPRLLNLREIWGDRVDVTLHRLEKPRIRISLRIAQIIIHIIFASFLIFFVFPIINKPHWEVSMVGIFLLLLINMEYLLEGWVVPNAEVLAIRMGWFAVALDMIISPLSMLAMLLAGMKGGKLLTVSAPTDDEMRIWVEGGQTDGVLEKEERKMIYSIFQFGDRLAREIMVPRIDMLTFDISTSPNQVVEDLVKSGHSRVPVYDGSIDNVIGILYAKDLLKVLRDRSDLKSLKSLIRPAYFVPEAKKLDELLAEMQSNRVHMAIVVDEYGGVAGLVTLENILEEIFGEIRDEYDSQEVSPSRMINPDEYIFQGSIDLEDFNEEMGTEISKDAAETLGGFIYGEIGKVPDGGEEILVENVRLIVEKVLDRRITEVRAIRIPVETGMNHGDTQQNIG
jgi:CBS domain containing-hemolysin-like protein